MTAVPSGVARRPTGPPLVRARKRARLRKAEGKRDLLDRHARLEQLLGALAADVFDQPAQRLAALLEVSAQRPCADAETLGHDCQRRCTLEVFLCGATHSRNERVRL